MHNSFSFFIFSPTLVIFFFFLFFFLTVVILTDMRWYLTVILIPLMISNVEPLITCLLATYIYSLEIYLYRSFAHFLFCAIFCCYWVVEVVYIFWVLTPYVIYSLPIVSSFHRLPLPGCFLTAQGWLLFECWLKFDSGNAHQCLFSHWFLIIPSSRFKS